MYCHSLIDVEHAEAWEIPASAVLVRDETTFCYEIRDGKTHRLPVRWDSATSDRVEILKFQLRSRMAGDPPKWDQSDRPGDDRGGPPERIDGQSIRSHGTGSGNGSTLGKRPASGEKRKNLSRAEEFLRNARSARRNSSTAKGCVPPDDRQANLSDPPAARKSALVISRCVKTGSW